jgi:hypothetical protein
MGSFCQKLNLQVLSHCFYHFSFQKNIIAVSFHKQQTMYFLFTQPFPFYMGILSLGYLKFQMINEISVSYLPITTMYLAVPEK